MPTYLHPGVYIEEIPSGAKPIEAVSTSTAAFVGPVYKGPAGEAELIHSLDEFFEKFGKVHQETGDGLEEQENAMVHSVRAFYLNGGKDAYICRLVNNDPPSQKAHAQVDGQDSGGKVIKIEATSVGKWGNDIRFRILKPDPDQTRFDLEIGYQAADGEFIIEEEFTDLNMNDADTNYVLTRVNGESSNVEISLEDAADPENAANYLNGSLTGGEIAMDQGTFDGLSDEMILKVSLDQKSPKTLTIKKASFEAPAADTDLARGKVIADEIVRQVGDGESADAYTKFECAYEDVGGKNRFVLTSGTDGPSSSVEVLDGDGGSKDLARYLKLDSEQKATLLGDTVPDTTEMVDMGDEMTLNIDLDGKGAKKIVIKKASLNLSSDAAADPANRQKLAAGIKNAVNEHSLRIESLADFNCEYITADKKFKLTSGSSSSRNSSIIVDVADPAANNLGAALNLVGGAAVSTLGRKVEHGTSKVIPVEIMGESGKINGLPLSNGAAELPTPADYASFYTNILRKVRDVSIMLLPGMAWNKELGNLKIGHTLTHCESTQSRVLIVDPPNDLEFEQAKDVTDLGLPTSKYSVLYYPWVEVPNPLYHAEKNPNVPDRVAIPPSGFAAGMWAKIDGKRGVWKAPAGVEAKLRGLIGLQHKVEDAEQDQLNPLGVNCYRKQPGYGTVIWGSRTLATKADPEWRYVPVRRTAIFIEQSIYGGIQWAVFEPNDTPLWGSLRGNIDDFMNGLFRVGAFQGAKAADAYFVRCGLGDTMTQADIDRGQVIIVVGFAPLKPAEFVILRLQQKVGQ